MLPEKDVMDAHKQGSWTGVLQIIYKGSDRFMGYAGLPLILT